MFVNKKLRQIFAVFFMFTLVTASLTIPAGKASAADAPIDIQAKSAILVDVETGKILFEKNANTVLPPASMSKMMVEYIILNAIEEGRLKWDQKVSISQYVYELSHNLNYSNVPLRRDYKYTVRELYEAMAIYSANGATVALAEALAGSEAAFVEKMNKMAKKMGIEKAKFVNTTGLNNKDLGKWASVGAPDAGNRISARGLAKLAYHIVTEFEKQALSISSTATKEFTAGIKEGDSSIFMVNWNWMLPGFSDNPNLDQFTYEGVDGLKTGFTNMAGYCFTSTAERGGRRLVSVVMGTDSIEARFQETRKLLNYGFNHFDTKTLVKEGYQFKKHKTIPVTKGDKEKVGIAVDKPLKAVVRVGQEKKYKPVLKLDESKLTKEGKLVAPVKKGNQVGYATVKYTGKDSQYGYLYDKGQKTPIITTDKVNKANWFVLAFRSVGDFVSGVFGSAVDMIKGLF